MVNQRRPSTADRSSRAHPHVHAPGEVRGQRLYPVFARAVALTVYRNGAWLVDRAQQDTVIARLAALQPTLVSSIFAFVPEEIPTDRHRQFFARLREAVRVTVPSARFDLELNAMAYVSGPQVVDHMRQLTDLLEPDLWLFTQWDEADRKNYAVVASASGQAHANGQAIGGTTTGREIATDSDFGVVRGSGDLRAVQRQLLALTSNHPLPYLVERSIVASAPDAWPPDVRAFALTRVVPTAIPPARALPPATPPR